MLRHTGKSRNFKHNLGLATFLAFNAGFINAAGFLAFRILTTHVTGHAALLAVDLANGDLNATKAAALWLTLFFLGSFICSMIIQAVGPDTQTAYTGPFFIILVCLGVVPWFGRSGQSQLAHQCFAGILLFAMGMQNAMVTVISGSVVRTTHLTGIFTDLGVDLARMALLDRRPILWLRIILRLRIITSFLFGGVAGSISFREISFKAFVLPVIVLLIVMLYDRFKPECKGVLKSKYLLKSSLFTRLKDNNKDCVKPDNVM